MVSLLGRVVPPPREIQLRTLVTFILRLWVDPQSEGHALIGGEGPVWEGQVECVADGARAHVRSVEDLARFIAAQTITSHGALNDQKER